MYILTKSDKNYCLSGPNLTVRVRSNFSQPVFIHNGVHEPHIVDVGKLPDTVVDTDTESGFSEPAFADRSEKIEASFDKIVEKVREDLLDLSDYQEAKADRSAARELARNPNPQEEAKAKEPFTGTKEESEE